ncbi:DUF6344 domain-containing protein [Streptomyces sp. NPDC005648]|uniref:DUF6344 domain-containing protein n=1 Tax=Streptomyces sp. NPDC005648 TaxID=3157044 RepID=UPI0033BDFBA2
MARTQVMKVWTAFVTALLALCSALGLVATAAPAAMAQTGATGKSTGTSTAAHRATMPTPSHHWVWSQARALPPTMKQRIRAEAHGKSPSCRHRPLDETTDATGETTEQCDPS